VGINFKMLRTFLADRGNAIKKNPNQKTANCTL